MKKKISESVAHFCPTYYPKCASATVIPINPSLSRWKTKVFDNIYFHVMSTFSSLFCYFRSICYRRSVGFCRESRVEGIMSRVEGKKCRHFFVILIKKNKQTKQNKTKQKTLKERKLKKKHRTGPETRTAILLIVNARDVPLRHQANPEVTRQN